jgi:SAM-dependent methyltransferase
MISICPVCQSVDWESFSLPTQHLVRSDCLPYKGEKPLKQCHHCGLIQSNAELSEDYYQAYDLDEADRGREQSLFSHLFAHPVPRSRLLVHIINQNLILPKMGRALDIGCNHGFFSAEFESKYPNWQVCGYEPWPRPSAIRNTFIRPENFFHGDFSSVSGPFDLISLVHVLEHIPDPLSALIKLPDLLTENGWLLIQVPDYSQTAFDLTIYDHIWHFNQETLYALLQQAGFEIVLSGTFLPKEVTALCRKQTQSRPAILPRKSKQLSQALKELTRVTQAVKAFEHASQTNQKMPVILGTAIAAGFVSGNLINPPKAYLDESPQEQGRQFWGKPVLALSQLKMSDPGLLFLPFPQAQAQRILSRLEPELPDWSFWF